MAKHPKIRITIEPMSEIEPGNLRAEFMFLHGGLVYQSSLNVPIKPLTTKQYEQAPAGERAEFEASYAFNANVLNRREVTMALNALYTNAIETWEAMHDPRHPTHAQNGTVACTEEH